MLFLIRSKDGRLTICTACADAAAMHAKRLRRSGSDVVVSDINGARYEVAGLRRRADALRAARTAVLDVA